MVPLGQVTAYPERRCRGTGVWRLISPTHLLSVGPWPPTYLLWACFPVCKLETRASSQPCVEVT